MKLPALDGYVSSIHVVGLHEWHAIWRSYLHDCIRFITGVLVGSGISSLQSSHHDKRAVLMFMVRIGFFFSILNVKGNHFL